MQNFRRLCFEDLNIPCKDMALSLLGKYLVRKLDDGSILKGRIVETECYLGGEDKASHSFGGRRTPGNVPMYMPAGTVYVYMTYGMYHCMNISSIEPGAAVLIRALHPVQGLELMQKHRLAKRSSKNCKPINETELCNGPSKLCMSLNITKDTCNKISLCDESSSNDNDILWLEEYAISGDEDEEIKQVVVHTSRIGIASAGVEWAQKPLRFYILSNPHVSRRDKKAEEALT